MADNTISKYSITTSDGKTHEVSKENIDKYGINAYAEAYKGATIRMRDKDGADYDIPLEHYESAAGEGLHPFSTGYRTVIVPDKQKNPPEESGKTDESPAQPAWQPTGQDKIRTSYQMGQAIDGFNKRTKEHLAQTRRMSEHFTPEGRERLKAAKFQAQLAGTPTKLMGLTPPTQLPAAEGGQTESGEQQQPVKSLQSPVPYGVKIVDGKRVTEWLLPDGRLTTNLTEADRSEYAARGNRLEHQFIGRMKQNGLDPSMPEDVQRQAQMDMQAPIYKHVAELWEEAEAKHKADVEKSASKHWDSYNAMGGGREMRTVTSAMNRHDRDKSHLTRFDLQTMMEDTWSRYGDQLTRECYDTLSRQNPGADDEKLRKSAEEMARSLSDNVVYQYAVEKNTPNSTLEYFGRTAADMNLINSISKGLARGGANGKIGDLPAYESAMSEYGKDHRFAQVAGTVTGMAVDPTTWISGGVGSMAGKGALWAGGKFVANRAANGMTRQIGSRLFASSLGGRLAIGAAGGAGNFATYEMMKEGERQFTYGGVLNPESLEVGDYSAGDVLKAGGHGLVMWKRHGDLTLWGTQDLTLRAK